MGRYEVRVWDSNSLSSRPYDGRTGSNESRFESFIPHPIASWTPVLSDGAKRLVQDAEAAIRDLNARGTEIHDADWLLRRAESASSSTIEGVHPSGRRLARSEAQLRLFGEEPRPNDQEALRNIFATERALAIADRGTSVTLDDIWDIHATLMHDERMHDEPMHDERMHDERMHDERMHDEPIAGRMRSTQNWIGVGSLNPTPSNAEFVPPPPEHVDALMNDLVACVNRIGDSPLVHAAVVHAQFETIHPFADGNGRTGRAVMLLMLRRSGLAGNCTVPISSVLAQRRAGYVRSLNATQIECGAFSEERSLSMSQWVEGLAHAAIQAAEHAEAVSDHVVSLTDVWRQSVARSGARQDSAAMRLLACLPNNPVVTRDSVSLLLGVSDRTARRAIRLLGDVGILVSRNVGKGLRAYEAHELLDVYVQLATVREGAPELPLARPTAE